MQTEPLVVEIYRIYSSVILPEYATNESACFDIRACLIGPDKVTIFSPNNESHPQYIDANYPLIIPSRCRALVPTGLIFNLPVGYTLRIHPRSGNAIKKGITLINCEGVIDADYTDEVMITLINTSNMEFLINHGDRLCQGEVIPVPKRSLFYESKVKPGKRGDRVGGFGSTGVQ